MKHVFRELAEAYKMVYSVAIVKGNQRILGVILVLTLEDSFREYHMAADCYHFMGVERF